MDRPDHPIPIADVPKILRMGSKTLFALLRQHQVLGPNNVAMPPYVHHRLFVIHNRRYRKSGTTARQWYQVSLVTPKGLSWLEQKLVQWQAQPIQTAS